MSNGNITEVYRELENEFKEKQAILSHFKKNQENKKEVDRIINNERLNLVIQESGTGNIWGNVETLTENIKKLNKEIGLYENLSDNKKENRNKFRYS